MLSLSKHGERNTSILRQAQDEVLPMTYIPSPQPLSPWERGLALSWLLAQGDDIIVIPGTKKSNPGRKSRRLVGRPDAGRYRADIGGAAAGRRRGRPLSAIDDAKSKPVAAENRGKRDQDGK